MQGPRSDVVGGGAPRRRSAVAQCSRRPSSRSTPCSAARRAGRPAGARRGARRPDRAPAAAPGQSGAPPGAGAARPGPARRSRASSISSTSRSQVRGPQRTWRTRPSPVSIASSVASSACGSSLVSTSATAFRNGGCSTPPRRLGAVERRAANDLDARRSVERGDGRLERCERIAEVGAEPDERPGDGTTSPWSSSRHAMASARLLAPAACAGST